MHRSPLLLLSCLAIAAVQGLPAQTAVARGPRLVDSIAAPMLYLSLDGGVAGKPIAAAPGPVQSLLADPAFDALFGAGAGAEDRLGAGAAGRALALVRGVLARSSGDLEIALTGVVPTAGQPLLVLRARLLGGEADRLRGLFEAATPEQGRLVEPYRSLGGHQTYSLLAAAGRSQAGAGELVELALVGSDLLVGNDMTAMQELLQPEQRTAAGRRTLAVDARFNALQKQLDLPAGSLLVYGDWPRLSQRLHASSAGLPAFLLEWSGFGEARAVMASVAGAEAGFTGTMLLDFDRRRQDEAPRPDGPRPDGPREGRPRLDGAARSIDGWFASAQSVPARTLLDELPAGGLGGLVLAVDLANIAKRSRRGEHMLRHLREAFRKYGLDFERNVLGKLGERGTVQLLFQHGDGAAATGVVSVYAARAKSRKAAAEVFADLRRAAEQQGLGRIVAGRDRRGPEVLELADEHAGAPAYVAVLEDAVLLAFDAETIAEVVEEHRRSARSRTKRDAAVSSAISTIGGDSVSGLFDLDLAPLFARLAAALGPKAAGPALDLSRLPQRHIGFVDLQSRDDGVVLRICVLSSR